MSIKDDIEIKVMRNSDIQNIRSKTLLLKLLNRTVQVQNMVLFHKVCLSTHYYLKALIFQSSPTTTHK